MSFLAKNQHQAPCALGTQRYSNLMTTTNYLYVNNTGADLSSFHAEIAASLKANGALPEELADVFTVEVACLNEDGSPRYVINAA